MQHMMNEPMMTGNVALIFGIAVGFVIGAHIIRYKMTKEYSELSHAMDHVLMAFVMLIATGSFVAIGQWAIAIWAVWLAVHMFGKIAGVLR